MDIPIYNKELEVVKMKIISKTLKKYSTIVIDEDDLIQQTVLATFINTI